jgi:hypothetical protein
VLGWEPNRTGSRVTIRVTSTCTVLDIRSVWNPSMWFVRSLPVAVPPIPKNSGSDWRRVRVRLRQPLGNENIQDRQRSGSNFCEHQTRISSTGSSRDTDESFVGNERTNEWLCIWNCMEPSLVVIITTKKTPYLDKIYEYGGYKLFFFWQTTIRYHNVIVLLPQHRHSNCLSKRSRSHLMIRGSRTKR